MAPEILLSIVVPIYCESDNLDSLIESLEKELKSLGCKYEIVLVDDGSTDGSWEIIAGYCSRNPFVNGIKFSRNFGKEAAISAGLEFARGNAIIIMDGDLQHPPSLIREMFQIWTVKKVHIVEAKKSERGDESLWAKARARIFYSMISVLSGLDLRSTTDYKLLDRKVIEAYLQMNERSLFFRGMVAWLGFKKEEVFFAVPKRLRGRSKWSLMALFKMAIGSILSFSFLPLRIVGIMGLLFIGFAFLLSFQVLFLKLSGQAVTGFATVILLLLIVGGMIMVALEIIGEYISQIYIEIKSRPRYLIEESIIK